MKPMSINYAIKNQMPKLSINILKKMWEQRTTGGERENSEEKLEILIDSARPKCDKPIRGTGDRSNLVRPMKHEVRD